MTMARDLTTRRWRELFVLCTLTVVLGGGAFLFLLLLGGGLLLAVLVAAAAIGVISTLHYVMWGHWLRRGTDPAGEPAASTYAANGAGPPRRP